MKQQPAHKKQFLVDKLMEQNAFWSYDGQAIKKSVVSDEFLIENVLLYLDIPEINRLFSMYPKEQIRQVWIEKLLPQGEYLFNLNKLLAWLYFGMKNEDEFVKNFDYERIV